MGELIFTILLFVGLTAIAAVIFGGWVIVSLVRFMARLVMDPFHGYEPAPQPSPAPSRRCGRRECQTENPAEARFCRRCGKPLAEARRVSVRRAAMW